MFATTLRRSLGTGSLLLLCLIQASAASAQAPIDEVRRDPVTAQARLLRFAAPPAGPRVPDPGAVAATQSGDAVRRHASLFGAMPASRFAPIGQPFFHADVGNGISAVRYAQQVDGYPVFGAQLVANVRGDGAMLLLAGEVSNLAAAPAQVASAPTSADADRSARDYVALRYGVDASALAVEDRGLWIFDPAITGFGVPGTRASLVHYRIVSLPGRPIRVVALLDAATLGMRLGYNTIHSSPQRPGAKALPALPHVAVAAPPRRKVAGVADAATYDGNNVQALPGTLVCDESQPACTGGVDPDADLAHLHAIGTYDFYFDLHGRDSLDDAGLQLVSTVHHLSGYCNAFWSGSQMAYGDGCNIVLDDVVGHELTHGMTQFTSDLIYAYDSGAINESLSDIWGEFYDLDNGTAEDVPAARWAVGEELQAGGIRNMQDPGLRGDPDRMLAPNFWTDARDIGGVHINSGVGNKAAYLLADGDTFNGQTMAGLGMEKPLHLFYYAQTMLLTPASDYVDLGLYLNAACATLVGTYGITAADCAEVEKVVLATEMAERSPHLPGSATICATPGQVPTDLLFEDFEDTLGSATRWTTVATIGANAWRVSTDDAPLAGLRSMRADNLTARSNSSASMNASVLLPAAAMLHFEQQYVWEYDGWDGAILEYSTNAGINWTKVQNATMSGEIYPGLMNGDSDAGFANQPAFTGDSFGAGSTRVDLAALAGSSVRFRFRAGSDVVQDAGNEDGWWIDNVRIYTCGFPPPGITVTPVDGLETSEAGSDASFEVALSAPPSQDVVIALSSSDAGEGAPSPATLTFTAANWQQAQTVTVTGVDDATVDGDSVYSIVTAAAASADAAYAGMAVADVSLVNLDDDVASIGLGEVIRDEGDAGPTEFAFSVVLDGDVEGGFTLPYATGDASAMAGSDYVAASGTLEFAGNDGEVHTVFVQVNGDRAIESDETFRFTVGAASKAGVVASVDESPGEILDDDTRADVEVENVLTGGIVRIPGETVAYVATVRNLSGNVDLIAVDVGYQVGASLTGTTWTCSATGGAVCPSAAGSGAIATTLALPAGAAVTYALAASVAVDAAGAAPIETLASATIRAPNADPAPANNSARTTVLLPALMQDGFE